MYKRLKDFLQTPSAMAYAGFWAMIPKLGFSLIIGLLVSIAWQTNVCSAVLLFSYPIVALIVDGILYHFKDKLWRPLPPNTRLPSAWKITPVELLQYAKEIPKIRLKRMLTIPVLMLLLIPALKEEQTSFIVLLSAVGVVSFFLSALFDPWFCKINHLKKPTFIEVHSVPYYDKTILDHNAHSFVIHPPLHNTSPINPRLGNEWQTINQQNPYRPGTMAWMTAQYQDTTRHLLLNDLDALSNTHHAAHSNNLWQTLVNHDDYYRNAHFNSSIDLSTNLNSSYASSSFDSNCYYSSSNPFNHASTDFNNISHFSQSIGTTSYMSDSSDGFSSIQINPFF